MIRHELITPKDIYKELWEGRNFEISHLWQRSVFLVTILVALMAGYGTIVMNIVNSECNTKTFFNESSKIIVMEENKNIPNSEDSGAKVNYKIRAYVPKDDLNSQTSLLNLVAFFLSTLGCVFSMLWIMMGKGAKRWYERYERSLNWYVERYCSPEVNAHKDFPAHGYLPEAWDVNDCLFSTKAGCYSVSKVNIIIGNVCWVCWGVTSIIHLIMTLSNILCCEWYFVLLLSLCVVSFINAGISCVLRMLCKSKA